MSFSFRYVVANALKAGRPREALETFPSKNEKKMATKKRKMRKRKTSARRDQLDRESFA
jgi:hypothetical protein